MRRKFTILATVALALAGTATSETVSNEWSEIAEYVLVESTEDVVYLGGWAHGLLSVTEDENGGFHVKGHYNYSRVRGEVVGNLAGDLSNMGLPYRATASGNNCFNVKTAETTTIVSHFNLIGQGSAPDLRVTMVSHVTVNANGEVTVERSRVTVTEK